MIEVIMVGIVLISQTSKEAKKIGTVNLFNGEQKVTVFFLLFKADC